MATAVERMQGGCSAGQAQALGGASGTVAALGSVQGDAAPVIASQTIVTGADGTKGAILPSGTVGDILTLFNSSASTLKVYPDVGGAISVNGTGLGSANAAFSQLAQKCTKYVRQSSTQWFAITSA